MESAGLAPPPPRVSPALQCCWEWPNNPSKTPLILWSGVRREIVDFASIRAVGRRSSGHQEFGRASETTEDSSRPLERIQPQETSLEDASTTTEEAAPTPGEEETSNRGSVAAVGHLVARARGSGVCVRGVLLCSLRLF